MTWACFRLFGNTWLSKLKFMRSVIGWAMVVEQDFRILAEMPSTPVALFVCNFEIDFWIESAFVWVNWNCSWGTSCWSLTFKILGCWVKSLTLLDPMSLATFTKKSLNTEHTSFWSDIIWPPSFKSIVGSSLLPFLDRKGFMVGQKSLDFGPPWQG